MEVDAIAGDPSSESDIPADLVWSTRIQEHSRTPKHIAALPRDASLHFLRHAAHEHAFRMSQKTLVLIDQESVHNGQCLQCFFRTRRRLDGRFGRFRGYPKQWLHCFSR